MPSSDDVRKSLLSSEHRSHNFREVRVRQPLDGAISGDLISVSRAHLDCLEAVSEILGHSQIGVAANLYTHVLPSLGKQAANLMEQVLTGGS